MSHSVLGNASSRLSQRTHSALRSLARAKYALWSATTLVGTNTNSSSKIIIIVDCSMIKFDDDQAPSTAVPAVKVELVDEGVHAVCFVRLRWR